MNRKLMSIASIIFALAFVAIFLIIWMSANNIIKTQADEISSLYKADAPFDTSLFDDKLVSGATLKNFIEDMNSNTFTRGYKTYGITSYEDKKVYRTTLHLNSTGAVDGLTVEDS